MQPPHTRPFIPLWVWLFALAGIILTLVYALDSTPLGEVELTIERNEAAQRAAEFLRERGVNPDEYWSTTSFNFDTNVQSYIVRSADRETLQTRAERDLDINHWRVRFWKELNPNQWEVEISSRTGRILGFRHTILEELPRPSLTITAAEQLAREQLPNVELEPLTQATITQPERTDYVFVWEDPRYHTVEAEYRYLVRVQGDQVDIVDEYYWLPDSWWREGAWQARRGALLATICWSLTYALTVLIGLTWLLEAQRGFLRRRWAWRLWLAVVAVGLLVMLNSIPLELDDYTWTQSLPAYLFERFLSYMDQLVTITITILFAGMVGEALVWQKTQGAVHMSETLTKRGLLSRPVVQALLIGGLVGIGQLGAVSFFYAIGAKFGVWSPLTSLYDDTLSTPFPPLYGLALGLLPAVGEELLFRLGGITVLTRWTGKRNFAIVFTAIVWAALHATYPQRPFFIRMLELSFVGILFGVLFVRYGVLAAMAAHFTYNASLYVPLFWGGSIWLFSAGVLAAAGVALLLIPALIYKLRGNSLLPDTAIAQPLPQALPDIHIAQQPWTQTMAWKRIMLACGLGLLVLGIIGWNRPPIQVRSSTAATAIAAAQQATPNEINLQGLYPAAVPVADWFNLDLHYLHETLEQTQLEPVIEQGIQRGWFIRWSAWDRPDSWEIELTPNNQVGGFRRILPEDAVGATLPITQARTLAQTELEQRITNTSSYELINESTTSLTNRSDHSFTWQTREPVVAQAYQRIRIDIQGNMIGRFNTSMYTPPEYQRERLQQTFLQTLGTNIRSILLWATSGILAILGIIGIARRTVTVQPWAWLGFIAGLSQLIIQLLGLNRSQLLELPRLASGISWAISNSVFIGGEITLLAAGAAWAWRWWEPQQPSLTQQFGSLLKPKQLPISSLAHGLLIFIWGLVIMNLNFWPNATSGLWSSVNTLDSWLPGVSSLLQAGLSALRATLLIIGMAGILIKLSRHRIWLAQLGLTLGIALSLVTLNETQDGLIFIASWLIIGGITYWFKYDLRSILIGALFYNLLPSLLLFLQTGPSWYQAQAWIIMIALGLLGYRAIGMHIKHNVTRP